MGHNVGERQFVTSRVYRDSSSTAATAAGITPNAATSSGIATIYLNQPTPAQNVHVQGDAAAARSAPNRGGFTIGQNLSFKDERLRSNPDQATAFGLAATTAPVVGIRVVAIDRVRRPAIGPAYAPETRTAGPDDPTVCGVSCRILRQIPLSAHVNLAVGADNKIVRHHQIQFVGGRGRARRMREHGAIGQKEGGEVMSPVHGERRAADHDVLSVEGRVEFTDQCVRAERCGGEGFAAEGDDEQQQKAREQASFHGSFTLLIAGEWRLLTGKCRPLNPRVKAVCRFGGRARGVTAITAID